jgi:murein DD-endopeptidase MepM/ murein hydrolase activator NlpD
MKTNPGSSGNTWENVNGEKLHSEDNTSLASGPRRHFEIRRSGSNISKEFLILVDLNTKPNKE